MNQVIFKPGKDGKSLIITRTFAVPVDKLWTAWTTQELLDQWWAPEPWKVDTKDFNFSEGGRWLYAMVGPQAEKHWSLEKFSHINPNKSFVTDDCFCDQEGRPNHHMPTNHWLIEFRGQGSGTQLTVTNTTGSADDLQKMVDMGFQQGFTMGLNQLEELLGKPTTN